MNKNQTIIKQILKFQSYFFAVVIIIILAWLSTNYLVPNYDAITKTLDEQKGLDERKNILFDKYTRLSKLQKSEELDNLKKITFILPEEKDVFSIFSGLDTQEKDSLVAVTQSDFRVGLVSTESAKVAGGTPTVYKTIDINFAASGSFDQILTMLKNLHSYKTRLFTAKNVSINYTDPQHINAAFTLSAYYMPFPSQIGDLEKKLPELTKNQIELKNMIISNAVLPTDETPSAVNGKNNLFK